jgi:hypothetical protein
MSELEGTYEIQPTEQVEPQEAAPELGRKGHGEAPNLVFVQFETPRGGRINLTMRTEYVGANGAKQLLRDLVDVLEFARKEYGLILSDSVDAHKRRGELFGGVEVVEREPARVERKNAENDNDAADNQVRWLKVTSVRKIYSPKTKQNYLVVKAGGSEFFAAEKNLPDPISIEDFDKAESRPPEEMRYVLVKGKNALKFSESQG